MALAGLKRYIADRKPVGKKFVAVISGANMDFTRLQFVAERAEHWQSEKGVKCSSNATAIVVGLVQLVVSTRTFSSRVFRALVGRSFESFFIY